MKKNAFYFTSIAFFILKIFKFLSWLFGHVSKWLDKKDNVNFKFYDVTAWLTNNTQIAQYLKKYRQNDNEIGQLIEWYMRNIFLAKACAKCGGETSPRPFLKNWKWAYLWINSPCTKCGRETSPRSFLKNWKWTYLWINSLRFYTDSFYCMVSWGLLQYVGTKLQTTCFHPY